MALHTALQIFRPQPTILGQGGLHRLRHSIYTFCATVPPSMSALAFTSKQGYILQGPYCNLPVRPFWHRLAISWIPRYLIMLTIIVLYLAINIHAEKQFTDFRIFRRPGMLHGRKFSYFSGKHPPNTAEPQKAKNSEPGRLVSGKDNADRSTVDRRRSDPISSGDTTRMDFQATRQGSVNAGPTLIKWLSAQRHRREPSGGGNDDTTSEDESASEDLNPDSSQCSNSGTRTKEPNTNGVIQVNQLMNKEMRKRRRAVRRQLRLLFIYPVVYFTSWLLPFVQNVLNYSDYRARHPLFVIMLLTYASIAGMGIADMIVFNLREQPWRHIPGNNGTILGSFRFWQFDSQISSRRSTLDSTAASSPQTLSVRTRPAERRVSSSSLNRALGNVPAPGGHDPLAGRRGSAADGIDERLWGDTIHRVNGMSCWDFRCRSDPKRQSTIAEGVSDVEEPPSEAVTQ